MMQIGNAKLLQNRRKTVPSDLNMCFTQKYLQPFCKDSQCNDKAVSEDDNRQRFRRKGKQVEGL